MECVAVGAIIVDVALSDARIAARLPAGDLERARRWYVEKLGLELAEERPGGLRYLVGGPSSPPTSPRGHADVPFTQLAFTVEDIEAEVAALRARGVVFEDYDIPGLDD